MHWPTTARRASCHRGVESSLGRAGDVAKSNMTMSPELSTGRSRKGPRSASRLGKKDGATNPHVLSWPGSWRVGLTARSSRRTSSRKPSASAKATRDASSSPSNIYVRKRTRPDLFLPNSGRVSAVEKSDLELGTRESYDSLAALGRGRRTLRRRLWRWKLWGRG